MNVKDAIQKRASVRSYLDKEISKEVLMELIEAARLGQSGNNAQPWRYKIISDKETKQKLKETEIFKQDFVYTAPIILICCVDPTQYPKTEFIKGIDHPDQIRAIRDLAFSIQNLALRATELEIGTCCIGWMDKEKVKQVLDLPEQYIVPYALTIGYPSEDIITHKKKDIDEILI